ncbi:MAG: hypothetical protein ACYTGY_20855 [Planctomycetota bacterium]
MDRLAQQVECLAVGAWRDHDLVAVEGRVDRILNQTERIARRAASGARTRIVIHVPDGLGLCRRDRDGRGDSNSNPAQESSQFHR